VTAVLDASAFLALVLNEPGSERVLPHVGGSVMSSVNYSEVLSKLADGGLPPALGEYLVEGLQIDILPFTADHAVRTARLRQATVGRGLSLGDRACLAVAEAEGARAITADRAWAGLDVDVDVVVVRGNG
jgi:PIN domain nuclease of toxin-antitoxin system